MNKQVVIIYQDNKPVEVCELKTFTAPADIVAIQKQAETNKTELLKAKELEKEKLEQRLVELEKRVLQAENELKLMRGEITETEYNELCLGTK